MKTFVLEALSYKVAEKVPTQVLSCEICEIFKNIFVAGFWLLVAAS